MSFRDQQNKCIVGCLLRPSSLVVSSWNPFRYSYYLFTMHNSATCFVLLMQRDISTKLPLHFLCKWICLHFIQNYKDVPQNHKLQRFLLLFDSPKWGIIKSLHELDISLIHQTKGNHLFKVKVFRQSEILLEIRISFISLLWLKHRLLIYLWIPGEPTSNGVIRIVIRRARSLLRLHIN